MRKNSLIDKMIIQVSQNLNKTNEEQHSRISKEVDSLIDKLT